MSTTKTWKAGKWCSADSAVPFISSPIERREGGYFSVLVREISIGSPPLPCVGQGATLTIHPTPKRSASLPKHGDQKVLVSGIRT